MHIDTISELKWSFVVLFVFAKFIYKIMQHALQIVTFYERNRFKDDRSCIDLRQCVEHKIQIT